VKTYYKLSSYIYVTRLTTGVTTVGECMVVSHQYFRWERINTCRTWPK